jgi:REP element-mobilizing transposase RayT
VSFEQNSQPSRERERAVLLTYLITFACYGTRLHGDESGSVDRDHNLPASRFLDTNSRRLSFERKLMAQPAYRMDACRRTVVLKAIRSTCLHRGWVLLAAHVRANHVHLVVQTSAPPEKVMNHLKAYASRLLSQEGFDEPGRKRWARHGSTRFLWSAPDVLHAIRYVVEAQGEAMAVFVAETTP